MNYVQMAYWVWIALFVASFVESGSGVVLVCTLLAGNLLARGAFAEGYGKPPRWFYNLWYWVEAWWAQPVWPFCQWCGWRLLLADDCGWYALHPFPSPHPSNNRLCCMHCLRGRPGKAHQRRHGVGDR